jgi:hypothetical protein
LLITEDRLGEGMTYVADLDAGTVVADRSFSEYLWKESNGTDQATLKNPDDRSDFTPALAVLRGYCPGYGTCIIRATADGQIEYEPLEIGT